MNDFLKNLFLSRRIPYKSFLYKSYYGLTFSLSKPLQAADFAEEVKFQCRQIHDWFCYKHILMETGMNQQRSLCCFRPQPPT